MITSVTRRGTGNCQHLGNIAAMCCLGDTRASSAGTPGAAYGIATCNKDTCQQGLQHWGEEPSSTGYSRLQMKSTHLDNAPVVRQLAIDLCLHISQLCVDSCTEAEVAGNHQSHELQAAAGQYQGALTSQQMLAVWLARPGLLVQKCCQMEACRKRISFATTGPHGKYAAEPVRPQHCDGSQDHCCSRLLLLIEALPQTCTCPPMYAAQTKDPPAQDGYLGTKIPPWPRQGLLKFSSNRSARTAPAAPGLHSASAAGEGCPPSRS